VIYIEGNIMSQYAWRDDVQQTPPIKNNIADKLKELKSTKPTKQIIEENLPGVVFVEELVKYSRNPEDYKFNIQYGGYEWFGVSVVDNEIHYDYYKKIDYDPTEPTYKTVYDFYNK
jgi:hypothetical protein